MKGAPKQALKAACGSVMPTSVPASLAVKPETKWYMTSLPSSTATGGRTPKASAVSSTIVLGGGPCDLGITFGVAESGYEKGVFFVVDLSERSSCCRSNSFIFLPSSDGDI